MNAKPPGAGREWAWTFIMTLLGAGLRLKGLGRLGFDHFDEGVHVLAGFWVFADGGLADYDPVAATYAPLGFPVLVGLAFLVLGLSDTAALLVSITAGTLTIPIVGWLGRRTFGPGAGAAAATFAALSGPHLVFSRTALTDVSFLLTWLLAIGAGMRFLERPGIARALPFGAAVALAQLFKYNGWMTGVIVALAIVPEAFQGVERRKAAVRAVGFGMVAAVVAAIVYAPWFAFIERHHGYRSLLALQGSFVSGPARWWPNWQQQMAQVEAMSGSMSGLGFGMVTRLGVALTMAWLGAAIGQASRPRPIPLRRRVVVLGLWALVLIASLAAPANLAWWVALAWVPLLILDRRPSARVVASWWLVMSAASPLYFPYARLWLPTVAVCWIAAGGLVAEVLRTVRAPSDRAARRPGWPIRRPSTPLVVAVVGVVLAMLGPLLLPQRVWPFPTVLTPSIGLRMATEEAKARYLQDPRRPPALDILGRRPMVFYLIQGSGVPFRLRSSPEDLIAEAVPGRLAVVDLAVVPEGGDDVRDRLEQAGWRFDGAIAVPMSIAALLDSYPGAVYQRPADRVATRVPTLGPPPDPSTVPGMEAFLFFRSERPGSP